MLGGDLEVVDGAAAGAWIEPGLGGEFGAVSLQVPRVFEAYARLFHSAGDADGNPVTWGEVARRLGRSAHPEMQWHQLVGASNPFSYDGSRWDGSPPNTGEMGDEELGPLCRVLAEHTADPDDCFFSLCEINHSSLTDVIAPEISRPRLLKLPWGRDHVVLRGPLASVDQIGSSERANGLSFAVFRYDSGEEPPEVVEPFDPDPFWSDAPSLIWPAERSWFVASEVDFDSTLVGGSRELVDALVAAPDLEVYEVEPETSLAAFADRLNWVPEPEED